MAGFESAPESVITSAREMAGFERGRPRERTAIPAFFSYPLAVSRRTPVASSIRRRLHPRRPSASICASFSRSKTFAMAPRLRTSKPEMSRTTSGEMAGFQVIMNGRIWVITEANLLVF